MRTARFAINGLFIGGVVGFVSYWVVFVFSDIIPTTADRLDIEESWILASVLLVSATLGCLIGAVLAIATRR